MTFTIRRSLSPRQRAWALFSLTDVSMHHCHTAINSNILTAIAFAEKATGISTEHATCFLLLQSKQIRATA